MKSSMSSMRILDKIGNNIDPWDTPRIISSHPLKAEPISADCLFLTDNFKSILDYSDLVCMLLI